MIIAIDIDKTIVDCRSMVYQVATKLEKALPKMPKKSKFLSKENVSKYRNLFGKIGDPKYYDPVENCIDVINDFSKEGNTVVLLSSRPNMCTFNNVILTWLEEHKLNYNFVVVNCADKAKFCEYHGINVLIDDSVRHCIKTNKKGIPTVLFDPKDKYGKDRKEFEEEQELSDYLTGESEKFESLDYNQRNVKESISGNLTPVKGKFAGKKDFYIAKSWNEVKSCVAEISRIYDKKNKEQQEENIMGM